MKILIIQFNAFNDKKIYFTKQISLLPLKLYDKKSFQTNIQVKRDKADGKKRRKRNETETSCIQKRNS